MVVINVETYGSISDCQSDASTKPQQSACEDISEELYQKHLEWLAVFKQGDTPPHQNQDERKVRCLNGVECRWWGQVPLSCISRPYDNKLGAGIIHGGGQGVILTGKVGNRWPLYCVVRCPEPVTPYQCRLGDLLCFVFIVRLLYFSVIDIPYLSLQYFDTVGWVFWPVKTVSHITYTVLAGT